MRGSGRRALTMPCCVDDVLLLCGEDAGELEHDGDSGSRGAVAGREVLVVPEEDYYSDVSTIAMFLAREAACSPPGAECPGRPRSVDRPGWSESVSWILKVKQRELHWLGWACNVLCSCVNQYYFFFHSF